MIIRMIVLVQPGKHTQCLVCSSVRDEPARCLRNQHGQEQDWHDEDTLEDDWNPPAIARVALDGGEAVIDPVREEDSYSFVSDRSLVNVAMVHAEIQGRKLNANICMRVIRIVNLETAAT